MWRMIPTAWREQLPLAQEGEMKIKLEE